MGEDVAPCRLLDKGDAVRGGVAGAQGVDAGANAVVVRRGKVGGGCSGLLEPRDGRRWQGRPVDEVQRRELLQPVGGEAVKPLVGDIGGVWAVGSVGVRAGDGGDVQPELMGGSCQVVEGPFFDVGFNGRGRLPGAAGHQGEQECARDDGSGHQQSWP
jgi:hypothetical protein